MTIRRVFAPKSPPRIAIDVSDADATWKWEAPKADAQGKFAGVALPLLEGERALEFDPSEVEVTQVVFAMREVPRALELRTRRPAKRVPPRKTSERTPWTTWLAIAAATIAVGLLSYVITRHSNAPIAIAMQTAPVIEVPTIEMPVVATAAATGAIVPTVKGHRLYVDGKMLGDSDGPVAIDCGAHSVKLGSNGFTKSVTVPCGGEVAVAP